MRWAKWWLTTIGSLGALLAADGYAGSLKEGVHYTETADGGHHLLGAPFNVVDRVLALPLQSKWHADLGGAVFAITRRGNRLIATAETGLYAIDAASGRTVWKYAGAAGRPTPVQTSADAVFFAASLQGDSEGDSGSSTIHLLDASSGKARWTYEREGGVFTSLSLDGAYLHAVLAMPDAHEAKDGLLVTLDAADGHLIWEKEIAEGDWQFNHATAAHGVVAVARRKPYEFNLGGVGKVLGFAAKLTEPATSWTYGLVAFDAASGDELWTYAVEGKMPIPTQVKRLLTTSDGVLFPLMGRTSEKPEADTFGLTFALNIKTGEPIWEQKDTWTLSREANKMKDWASIGHLAGDRYLYGQGIGKEAQQIYLICVDIREGKMLWRETVKSKRLANAFKEAFNAQKNADNKSRAKREAQREARESGYGSATYTVEKIDPRELFIMGDSMTTFTHLGIFINFPGDNKVQRYFGGKELWSAKYKIDKKQTMLMPQKIASNYMPIGDTSGRVRFFGLEKGKTNKKMDIDLGAPLYQIRVDGDVLLLAAENGLHAY